MRPRRSMPERQRAFLALGGQRFPLVGQRGLCTIPPSPWLSRHGHAEIEVLSISQAGNALWTRFLSEAARVAFAGTRGEQRWWFAGREEMTYGPWPVDNDLLRGTVSFPDVIPPEKLLPLRDDAFPRVGDRAVFSVGFSEADAGDGDDELRTVEVLSISETGTTIETRFVRADGQERFGEGMPIHYWASPGPGRPYQSYDTVGPFGQLRFR